MTQKRMSLDEVASLVWLTVRVAQLVVGIIFAWLLWKVFA